MIEALRIRPGSSADLRGMADLMAASVRALGPAQYDSDQVAAWAAAAHEEGRFSRLVDGALTLVAEDGATLVAFGALTPGGHLTALYTHPEYVRRGIGSAVLSGLLEYAARQGMEEIHTEASEFSRPLFRKVGFRVDAVETVERNGVQLPRARMSLRLATGRATDQQP